LGFWVEEFRFKVGLSAVSLHRSEPFWLSLPKCEGRAASFISVQIRLFLIHCAVNFVNLTKLTFSLVINAG